MIGQQRLKVVLDVENSSDDQQYNYGNNDFGGGKDRSITLVTNAVP